MANETLNGFGYLLLKDEGASYGTDPTPDESNDLVEAEDVAVALEVRALERRGKSSRRPGWKSAAGAHIWTLAAMFEIWACTVTQASDVPGCHPAALMAGFSNAFADTGGTYPKTQTYTLEDFDHPSVTAWLYELSYDQANNNLWKLNGLRGDFELDLPEGEICHLSVNAIAKTGAVTEDTGAVPNLDFADVTGEAREPLVFLGATLTVFDTDDAVPVTYGGELLSLRVSGNNNPQAQIVSSETNGVARVQQVPEGPIDVELRIEAIPVGDQDFRGYVQSRTTLHVQVTLTDAVDSNDTWDVDLYLDIHNVASSLEAGREVLTLATKGLWPDAGSGVGVRPATQMTMTWTSAAA